MNPWHAVIAFETQGYVPIVKDGANSLKGILIVKADSQISEINQLLFRTQLESLGYRCTLVADGLEALKALEKAAYDLILTDVSMPNLGGLELTSKIRTGQSALKEKGEQIPIVACSANAMNDDQEAGLDAGVDAYLTKPFKKEQLAGVLQTVLGGKKPT